MDQISFYDLQLYSQLKECYLNINRQLGGCILASRSECKEFKYSQLSFDVNTLLTWMEKVHSYSTVAWV